MESRPIEERVATVFQQALGLPAQVEWAALEYRSEPRWDSVGHLHLVTELEREFRIVIANDDVLNLTSFGEVVETVRKYVSD